MRKAKLYGLLGREIAYSFSPGYFKAKFEREDIEDVHYGLFDYGRLDEFFDWANKQKDLMGFNITIPYKEEVIPFLSSLSKTAKEIGAVNTVLKTSRGWQGYNTDVYGFKQAILPRLKPEHISALILGSGGASKAVRYGLSQLNIKTKTVSRSVDKGDLTYELLTDDIMSSHQLIINTSPLGSQNYIDLKPPISYEAITSSHLLFDLIYNPEQTLFLQTGMQQGADTLNGLTMLEYQAEKSWEIWTER